MESQEQKYNLAILAGLQYHFCEKANPVKHEGKYTCNKTKQNKPIIFCSMRQAAPTDQGIAGLDHCVQQLKYRIGLQHIRD